MTSTKGSQWALFPHQRGPKLPNRAWRQQSSLLWHACDQPWRDRASQRSQVHPSLATEQLLPLFKFLLKQNRPTRTPLQPVSRLPAAHPHHRPPVQLHHKSNYSHPQKPLNKPRGSCLVPSAADRKTRRRVADLRPEGNPHHHHHQKIGVFSLIEKIYQEKRKKNPIFV